MEAELAVIITVPYKPGIPERVALVLARRPHRKRIVHVGYVVVEGRREMEKLLIRIGLSLVHEVAHREYVIGSVAGARARGARRHLHAACFHTGPVTHKMRIARDP